MIGLVDFSNAIARILIVVILIVHIPHLSKLKRKERQNLVWRCISLLWKVVG